MAIDTGVALMGVAQQNQGDLEVFTVGTAQATLSHLINQQQSGNWQVAELQVPTSGQVEEFISYSTDLMVFDATGAPIPNAPIQIWAASQTQIVVNGATYTIDAHTPANLTCSTSGTLSVTQGTGILGIPALQINVVNQMPSGQGIALEQYAGVQQRLETVTGTDLMNAKTADGQYLLQSQYRTVEQTDSLATAFNQCMALTSNPVMARDTQHAMVGRSPKRGVGAVDGGTPHLLRRIAPPTTSTHWQLDFRGGKPVYRDLSADDAHQLLLDKRASHVASAQSVGGFLDWVGSIGDFVQGVVDGIVSVVDTIITTVGNAVNAAITFVVNGVTYLFETVVEFIDQAFDLVEVFFAQVQVIFQQIFEWLGFIFSWPDILRTHDALSYTMTQFLGFLPGAVAGIQRLFDQGIATAQSEIASIFDQLVASVGATASLGSYTESQTPSEPVYSAGNSNNIVLNATLENSSSASQTTTVLPPNASPWDILTQQIETWTNSVQQDPAFASALSYMQNLGGNPDQIFAQLISALLRVAQGLANAMLSGVQAIVDGLLQLVQDFLTTLQQQFTAQWNIPFVTQFYAWLTNGSPLTLADLTALILAIPSTIIYKALYGAAPFPDQASVDQFKASFNSQSMLDNSGLATTSQVRARTVASADAGQSSQVVPLQADAVNSAQTLLSISAVVSNFAFGFLSAGLDIQPTTGAGVVNPLTKTLTKFALGTEIYAQAAYCPWIYSSGGPNCSNADGAGKWVWIYTCLGVVLDCGFTVFESAFPENNDTVWGIVVATLYGVGHAVVTGITASELSGLNLAGNIVQCIPEVCKLLKLPTIETATSGWSLVVVAAADALCLPAAGIIFFADIQASSSPAQVAVAGAVPTLTLA